MNDGFFWMMMIMPVLTIVIGTLLINYLSSTNKSFLNEKKIDDSTYKLLSIVSCTKNNNLKNQQ